MLEIKDYLGIAAILIALATTLYNWLTSSSRHNEESIEKHGDRLSELESKVTKIDSEMQHMPDKTSQHRLELAMTEMAGETKLMAEALSTTTRTVRRMEDFLLNNKGE